MAGERLGRRDLARLDFFLDVHQVRPNQASVHGCSPRFPLILELLRICALAISYHRPPKTSSPARGGRLAPYRKPFRLRASRFASALRNSLPEKLRHARGRKSDSPRNSKRTGGVSSWSLHRIPLALSGRNSTPLPAVRGASLCDILRTSWNAQINSSPNAPRRGGRERSERWRGTRSMGPSPRVPGEICLRPLAPTPAIRPKKREEFFIFTGD